MTTTPVAGPIALLLALALLPACEGSGSLTDDPTPPPATSPEEVSIVAFDGLRLSGTYQAAPGAAAGPALLLLHQFERDRHDFDALGPDLLAAGYSLLAIDFRSHGASEEADIPRNSLLSDRDQLGYDVRAALAYLQGRSSAVDPARVGVIGLSVGGNMAIVANHRTHGGGASWGAQAIATVSARQDRAEDLAGDNTLSLRDGLYIAGDDESPQNEDADALAAITAGDAEALRVAGTSAHGVALLDADPAVRARLVAWFEEIGL